MKQQSKCRGRHVPSKAYSCTKESQTFCFRLEGKKMDEDEVGEEGWSMKGSKEKEGEENEDRCW